MSYIVSAACVRLKCPGVAKAVLMQLADIANDDGYAWPSIETLCMRTDWGRTAVIDALEWLEHRAALQRDRSNGRKTVYRITPDLFTGDRHPAPSGRTQLLQLSPNQSATRTGTAGGPVRHADRTSPPNGPDQSAKRTLTINNHQEPHNPLTPAGAGECGQARKARKPKAPWRWRESWEGVLARGEQLGIPFTATAGRTGWTDDEMTRWRAEYRDKVERAHAIEEEVGAC